MISLNLLLLVLAALGSGMMAGLFCSFSNFIMKALAQTPPPTGIRAMQSINEVIVRPAFLLVFLGTGVACALAVVLGWQQFSNAALVWAIAGAVVYVLGSIVVTIVFNVPLNNRLAAVDADSEAGAQMWQIYLVRWVRWNHVRSIASIVSTLLLIMAILSLA